MEIVKQSKRIGFSDILFKSQVSYSPKSEHNNVYINNSVLGINRLLTSCISENLSTTTGTYVHASLINREPHSTPTYITNIFSIQFTNTVECDIAFDTTKDYIEQFSDMCKFFPFNKTEWAKIFSVSRVTIYDWINNKATPSGDNAKRISAIYKLVNSVTISDKDFGIFRGYLHNNLSTYNSSLLEIFASSTDILTDYEGIAHVLEGLMHQSKTKQNRLEKLSRTKTTKDHILDDNIAHLNL